MVWIVYMDSTDYKFQLYQKFNSCVSNSMTCLFLDSCSQHLHQTKRNIDLNISRTDANNIFKYERIVSPYLHLYSKRTKAQSKTTYEHHEKETHNSTFYKIAGRP